MSEIVFWKRTVVGEELSESKHAWIIRNQNRLLKAFPPAERAFCRILDKMVSRLPHWKNRLRYTRQKCFKVAPEILFFGDFYFRSLRLLVEIDGTSHLGPQAREKDAWRSRLLTAFRDTAVFRLANTDVLMGDFRAIEQRFIDIASTQCPPAIGHRLQYDYRVMQESHPHIYLCPEPLSTRRKKRA